MREGKEMLQCVYRGGGGGGGGLGQQWCIIIILTGSFALICVKESTLRSNKH